MTLITGKSKTAHEQAGRSMIEMLGVLAIIGILSVGGIAGYSKAMERYRVNETINQISHIVQNTRDLFKTQPNLYGAMSFSCSSMSNVNFMNRQIADKTNLFPASVSQNDYKNLFGGEISFCADGRFIEDDGKSFIIKFSGLPQEACIELATRDWQGALGLVAIKIRGTSDGFSSIQRTYISNCVSGYKIGASLVCGKDMPMTVEAATSACDEEKNNTIMWKFY